MNDTLKNAKVAQGKNELIKFKNGQFLTRKETMLANCYECTCYYHDGKVSCQNEACVFFSYMPYKNKNPEKISD